MTIVMTGLSINKLNGRVTRGIKPFVNLLSVRALDSSNYWSSSEYNSNNAWNVNFGGTNSNNNNKNNSNYVRAVAALDIEDEVSVVEAYKDCCRNKKGSPQCVDYRLKAEQLLGLALAIKERRYQPITSEAFVVTTPKLREIFAASFQDRIVQHWIYLRINPLFEARFRSMGDVSFNCRKGFGTIAARQRVYDDMHKYGFGNDLYVGKFDFLSFFMTIDLNILWEKLEPFIIENYKGQDMDTLLYLTKITVFHRPQENCIRKGNLDLWCDLPLSKSLFGKDEHTGMAIGNITSQVLCNFYLSFFDEWMLNRIKELGHEHPEEHYARFVDDYTTHSMPVEHVKILHKEAAPWLKENLHLTLHPDKVYIQPQRHGVQFVGGVIMPGRMYVINRTVGAMSNKVKFTDTLCQVIVTKGVSESRLALLEHCVSSLNSYSGFLRHGKTYNIQKKMLLELPWFWKVCYTTKNLSVVKIKKKYKLSNYLLNEQELQRRITRSFRPRRSNTFPDDKFLRRRAGW